LVNQTCSTRWHYQRNDNDLNTRIDAAHQSGKNWFTDLFVIKPTGKETWHAKDQNLDWSPHFNKSLKGIYFGSTADLTFSAEDKTPTEATFQFTLHNNALMGVIYYKDFSIYCFGKIRPEERAIQGYGVGDVDGFWFHFLIEYSQDLHSEMKKLGPEALWAGTVYNLQMYLYDGRYPDRRFLTIISDPDNLLTLKLEFAYPILTASHPITDLIDATAAFSTTGEGLALNAFNFT
jgi:hypothetical protein